MAAKPLDAVIADLTHETAGWKSYSVAIALEQTLHAPVGLSVAGTVTRSREHYLATRHGERKYGQYAEVGDQEICVLLGFDETDRCASVQYQAPPNQARQKSITITKPFLDEARTGFKAIPAPLPFYVGLVPIRDAIRSAEAVGPSQVAGRECDRYYFAHVDGHGGTQDLVYHLDAATSYPLKVESFADRARFAAGTPFSIWEADRLDEVRDYHSVTDSRFITYAPTKVGGLEPQLVNKYHVELIHFDMAIPNDAFWPKYDPGVFVTDQITGNSRYNTPDGKAPVAAGTATDPNGLPWTGWAFTGAVTVGLALLVVGLLRWFRGQSG